MIGCSHPGYAAHVAQEPAEEVNQMDSLFHKLPTTDDLRIRAPFFFDPFATGDAVASPTKDRLSDLARAK